MLIKKKRRVIDIIGFWDEDLKEEYKSLSMLEVFEIVLDEIRKKKKE